MTRYRIQIEQFIILAGKKKKFILDAGALQSHFFLFLNTASSNTSLSNQKLKLFLYNMHLHAAAQLWRTGSQWNILWQPYQSVCVRVCWRFQGLRLCQFEDAM